jgi:DNA-binding LytR/AlgR family response regulator
MSDIKIRCIAVDDEPPALEVMKKYIESVQTLELVATCSDAIDAINILQQQSIDLIFLDIKMPEILGTDFVKTLKNPPKIIFTTAYRKFALEGFELDAVDYLLKPISFDRFLKAVNKLVDMRIVKNTSNHASAKPRQEISEVVYFRSNRKMIKVELDEILFVESLKDYIKVVTRNRAIVTKHSISSLEENLPKDRFLRIHRSFIVAIDKIESYTNETIEISKKELPISRMYRYGVDKVLQEKRHLL